jgi:hypothetical protein
MTQRSLDFLDPEPEGPVRKGGHIPYKPDRDAPLTEQRHWLSNAIGLPSTVRADSVVRPGRNEDDALIITLSNDMVLRCDRQKRLFTSGTLIPWLISESDSLCRPAYLTKAECADVYQVLCLLATVATEQDELSELTERVHMFVAMCEQVHASLTRQPRYDTIRLVRRRPEYDRKAATDGKLGRHGPRPVLIVDHMWSDNGAATYMIRHSELIAHLRHVHSQQISDSFLKGRMAEIGCTYHSLQAFGSGRRGHVALTFYQLADDMPVPHLDTHD